MRKVNWRERYEQLKALSSQLVDKIHELGLLQSRITNHIRETDRLRLLEENKTRFLRVKETITINMLRDFEDTKESRTFEAGILLDLNMHGSIAQLYVDDGYYEFYPNQVEVVELEDKDIDWNKVIGSNV